MNHANRHPFRVRPRFAIAILGVAVLLAIVLLYFVWMQCKAALAVPESGASKVADHQSRPSKATGHQSRPSSFGKLLPLHTKLGKPAPGDWLAEHYEAGQTFRQYLRSDPVRADAQRTIYVQPLGEMNPTQRKIVNLTADCLRAYYQLPVKVLANLPLDSVPDAARREKNDVHDAQILTGYALESVLKPRLPKDAVALIAFTTIDLWPGEGWNYLFGEASLSDRVGVWSIHRFGDPDAGADAFRLCLLRTLKVATHETGHMFSLPHCTFYRCNMY